MKTPHNHIIKQHQSTELHDLYIVEKMKWRCEICGHVRKMTLLCLSRKGVIDRQSERLQQIEDDALYTQALFFEHMANYSAAEANLLSLLDFHPESLLYDDSIFKLGMLYQDHLAEPEKAKVMFERIIFEYPSSIYLVDARAAFRKLRGDDI